MAAKEKIAPVGARRREDQTDEMMARSIERLVQAARATPGNPEPIDRPASAEVLRAEIQELAAQDLSQTPKPVDEVTVSEMARMMAARPLRKPEPPPPHSTARLTEGLAPPMPPPPPEPTRIPPADDEVPQLFPSEPSHTVAADRPQVDPVKGWKPPVIQLKGRGGAGNVGGTSA